MLLFNHGEGEYRVKEGERVAQLILERVCFFWFFFLFLLLLLSCLCGERMGKRGFE